MSLVVVGLNHRTAPVEIRERFAFSPGAVPTALKRLLESPGALETTLISTCNRTEVYVHQGGVEERIEEVVEVLAEQAGELPQPIEHYLYMHRDLEAVRHLYRVASGLDSMVLGEVEIQGQVRDAYELSRSVVGSRPAVGPVFHRLFQTALSVGGRVRSETRLSEGAASVPSAAVELARKIFGSLRGRRGLVLGAGEMGALTLRCLASEGMEEVVIASRDVEHATRLAREVGGTPVAYADFWAHLPEIDVLISATAAPHPVVRLDQFRQAVPHELRTPLFILDIALPRDVEPQVGDVTNVFLYTIDDLEQIVHENFERRESEIPRADAMVQQAAEDYWHWYAGLQAVPLIRRVRERGELMRRRELERSMASLSHLSERDREEIDRLTRSLINKLLHDPTVRLRAAVSEDGRGRGVLEAARYLFGIDEERTETEGEPDHGRPSE